MHFSLVDRAPTKSATKIMILYLITYLHPAVTRAEDNYNNARFCQMKMYIFSSRDIYLVRSVKICEPICPVCHLFYNLVLGRTFSINNIQEKNQQKERLWE